MKGLGILAVVAVIVQGVLGGTRVTQVSTLLAAVHGCTGQAFFALMVALCVLTGREWQKSQLTVPDIARVRPHALLILGLIGGQIMLGAWLRHYGTREALISHAAFALVVWVSAVHLLAGSSGDGRALRPWFRRRGLWRAHGHASDRVGYHCLDLLVTF